MIVYDKLKCFKTILLAILKNFSKDLKPMKLEGQQPSIDAYILILLGRVLMNIKSQLFQCIKLTQQQFLIKIVNFKIQYACIFLEAQFDISQH